MTEGLRRHAGKSKRVCFYLGILSSLSLQIFGYPVPRVIMGKREGPIYFLAWGQRFRIASTDRTDVITLQGAPDGSLLGAMAKRLGVLCKHFGCCPELTDRLFGFALAQE